MIDTKMDTHPPPLCDACAYDFHDRCTGRAHLPPVAGGANAPITPCSCRCEPARRYRLDTPTPATAAGLVDEPDVMRPPVTFSRDDVAELANLAGVQVAGPQPAVLPRPRWSPARLAYWFYGVAAAGAVIGQTWVALEHVPWGPGVPDWALLAAVLPFALCLELLAMALAWLGDERQRLGERAYGFRVFSAVVAVVAVGILIAGHLPNLYWSGAFGTLSSSAYVLWLLHAAARRRDALRAAGKLAATAPSYGLYRRVRHPILTARAAELAREQGLGLYPSLRAAELAIRAEKRRPAIADAVADLVRGDHRDPRMARIAVTTLDLDRIAAELADRANYAAWADRLAPAVAADEPMPEPGPEPAGRNSSGRARRNSSGRGTTRTRNGSGRRSGGTVPGGAAERIRALAAEHPDWNREQLAQQAGVTDRYVRRVLNATTTDPV